MRPSATRPEQVPSDAMRGSRMNLVHAMCRCAGAGQALLPEVLELLARTQALPEHARAVAAAELGRLRLGSMGFLS